MTVERDAILCEMGLGPLWKRRQAASDAVIETLTPVAGTAPPIDVAARAVAENAMATNAGDSADADRAARIARLDWDALKLDVAACRACGLCAARKQAVLGVGDTQADWLFVGEGPGAEEDERGEPFVGAAGKLLDAMLAAIDLRRGNDVYIANAVKCRPPNNRTPHVDETAACQPYLQRQIALLQPKLIVALGRPAAQTLLGSEISISAARGRLFSYQNIPLIVTYHPAYLLRTLPDKAKAWEDLVFARNTMRALKAGN